MIYPYCGVASEFIKSKGIQGKIRYGHGILSAGLKLYIVSAVGLTIRKSRFSSPVLNGHGVIGKINVFINQETGDEHFCQLAETDKYDRPINVKLRFAIGRYTGIDGKYTTPLYYAIFSYSSDSRFLALFDATSYNRLVNQIHRTQSDNVITLTQTRKPSATGIFSILMLQHIDIHVARWFD